MLTRRTIIHSAEKLSRNSRTAYREQDIASLRSAVLAKAGGKCGEPGRFYVDMHVKIAAISRTFEPPDRAEANAWKVPLPGNG
jgi:hypothetical protein